MSVSAEIWSRMQYLQRTNTREFVNKTNTSIRQRMKEWTLKNTSSPKELDICHSKKIQNLKGQFYDKSINQIR